MEKAKHFVVCITLCLALNENACAFVDICPNMMELAKQSVAYRDAGLPYEKAMMKMGMTNGQMGLDPEVLGYARFVSYHIYTSAMTERDAIDYVAKDFCSVHP